MDYQSNQSSTFALSKALSWILRHGAVKFSLDMTSDGYVLWSDINKLQRFQQYTLDEVRHVVKTNDKQRFTLKEEDGKVYIRANQGHSNKVAANINQEELLTKLDKPLPMIVHGTTFTAYKSIRNSGLKKMGRSHVHFAISDDIKTGNEQQSGIRSNCQVLIYLDMAKAMADGLEFFISDNKVVLCQGIGNDGLIDKKYFLKVINRANGQPV